MTAGPPWRVVLADDAEDLRLLLALHLGRDDRFDVVGLAADGLEALEVVAAQRPDVLLLDLAMPRLDGLQVLERLRAAGSEVAVVVVSGFSAGDVADQALALGARAYVEKGAALTTLVDDMEAWLRRDEEPSVR